MPAPAVEFYTRKGCHLCDDAKAIVERVRRRESFELKVIEVDTDPALAERYGLEVPVVLVDGRKHAKFHVDEARFAERVRGARDERAAPIASVADEPRG